MTTTPSPTASPITTYLLDQLRQHGLSFLLLGLAVWYFQGENQEMKREIRACNNTIIQMYDSAQKQLLQVVEENTKELREFNHPHIDR